MLSTRKNQITSEWRRPKKPSDYIAEKPYMAIYSRPLANRAKAMACCAAGSFRHHNYLGIQRVSAEPECQVMAHEKKTAFSPNANNPCAARCSHCHANAPCLGAVEEGRAIPPRQPTTSKTPAAILRQPRSSVSRTSFSRSCQILQVGRSSDTWLGELLRKTNRDVRQRAGRSTQSACERRVFGEYVQGVSAACERLAPEIEQPRTRRLLT